MLAKVVSDHQTDWDYHLPQILFAYRTAIHDTTGFTPFHITFACQPPPMPPANSQRPNPEW